MANSIVGAGIIGLPYSFRESGFWSGIILLVILTGIVDWTVGLLIKNSRMSSKQSYQDLMEFCYGRAGLWAISIFQFIFAFGAMCAYNVIIGDTIPSVFIATFPSIVDYPILSLLASRRAVIFLCTIGITFPLSLYRDIAKLAKATFVCHHNTFVILNALKSPSLKRFSVVTHLSMGVSLITCLLMAPVVIGHLRTRQKVASKHFVVREVVEVLFLKEPITMLTNFILTTILIGAALIVALTTCDLGFVMELTGGISATALAFILPPACYVKLASGPLWSRKKLPSLVCIVFGVIVMCLSTTLSIQDYFYNTGKRKICQW
ncbi:transmembrane amino acid transporter protein-domain-containing protein [Syncephalis plumigaleata]|nr:transmembrane amino acid transporter protein-domain-containing protein [Syncephalis plumigaleata]